MDFPESVVEEAWERAGGKCECERTSHGHKGRCNKALVWKNRGREDSSYWEAHHVTSQEAGGKGILSNCEILCWDCHKKTF